LSKLKKVLLKIMQGDTDKTIRFKDLCSVLDRLMFKNRIKGDHFIYYKDGVDEIINIQPLAGLAKPYQVKQVRRIILRYKLGGTIE
jgi:hypothetical protein